MLRGRVLLTGGSGTLGKAFLLLAEKEHWPIDITVFARSESRLAQLKRRFPPVRCVIGDVRDYWSVHAAVAGHDIVIHMAAMKRIPECETQASECIAVNVHGTENVLRACAHTDVQECVVVSTDKACRASTTYGASKLLAEGLMAAYAVRSPHVRYHGVRYGNVMASNGSVVQLWRGQQAKGEPLSVTDAEMTRFWMSPFDAARLVATAASLGSSVIRVPKMSSLGVGEMAKMLFPHSAIDVVGFRSNEKLHEDLIHPNEPVQQDETGFSICTTAQPRWQLGVTYSSDAAPRLTREALVQMLADAHEVDTCV